MLMNLQFGFNAISINTGAKIGTAAANHLFQRFSSDLKIEMFRRNTHVASKIMKNTFWYHFFSFHPISRTKLHKRLLIKKIAIT